jgi:SPP1 gp7 family putative phage head morphogenesis protein
MDQAISRTLATGLVEGIGGDELAKRLLRDVENIGINRARMLARTEVIRAHHSATIQSYKNAAVENVIIQAEFSTAGDLRVCQKCNDLNGKIFTLDEIEPIIPVHPNCRCIALPYFPTEIEKKKIESNKWAVYEGKILNTPKRIRKAVLDLNTILSSLELIKDYKRRINELSNKIDDLYRSDLATVEIAKEKFKLSKEIEELKNKMILIEREEINKIFHSPIKSDIDFIIHDNFGELDLKRIKEETELITDWLGYKTFDFPSCYIQKTDSLRSHYSNFQIRLSPVFSKGSTTHEIGHWFEEQIPGALDKTKEFLEKRTGNNPLIPLGEGFSDNEYYRKGFKNRYVGKDYSRDPNDRSTVYATEVLSIGLETLYLDPIAFAYEDPEFFEFIIGLLKDML